jgi:Family of unknown function (DUF6428)
MLLSQFRAQLQGLSEVSFVKPDGSLVPAHFHITEVGQISKKFIDCGGTVRQEETVGMQLWQSVDVWHRLSPQKLIDIIDLAIETLKIGDQDIEIEYQSDTIGKYHVDFAQGQFLLRQTQTACLAPDQCGVPSLKVIKAKVENCCPPGGGCC